MGYGANSFAPVAAAMRPAVANPSPYNAFPPIRIAVGNPDRSMAAARSTAGLDGSGAVGKTGGAATVPPSLHETSAGTIRVAIWPGAWRAAATASAASLPTLSGAADVRTHFE